MFCTDIRTTVLAIIMTFTFACSALAQNSGAVSPVPAPEALAMPPTTMIEMPGLIHLSSAWLNPEDTSCVRPAVKVTLDNAAIDAILNTNRAHSGIRSKRHPDKRSHKKVKSPLALPQITTIGGPGAKTEVCFPGAQSIFLPDEPEVVAAKLQMTIKLTMLDGSPLWVNPSQVAGVGTGVPGFARTKTQLDIPDGSHLWVREDVDAVAKMLHFSARLTRPGNMVQYVNPAWVAHLFIPVKDFGAKEAKTQITIGTSLMYFVVEPIGEVATQLKAAATN